MTSAIWKWLRVSPQEKLLFLWLYFLSGIARICIFLIPFRYLAKYLGKKNLSTSKNLTVSPQMTPLLLLLKKNIKRVSRWTPWESLCFVQALIAIHVLKYYRLPYTVYFGVTKNPNNNQLKAHAWTKVGDFYVTGERGVRNFTIVSFFSGSCSRRRYVEASKFNSKLL